MSTFDYWHENVPAPFNTDYKHYASAAMTITVKQLQEEGFYDNYTIEERMKSGKIKARYKLICQEFEDGVRKMPQKKY
jgi:hypothetical protein